MTTPEAFEFLSRFHSALTISSVATVGFFSWLFGSNDADQEVIEANDFILESLSDSDRMRIIEALTDKDLRDQITLEEAQKLYEESETRKKGGWWN